MNRRFTRPAPGPLAPTGDHARYLVEHGLALVHVPKGKKGPIYSAWQRNPITDPHVAARYYSQHPSDSIGVVLGPSGLCSLDVDDPARARQALAAVGIDLDGLLDDSSIPRVEGNPEKARLLFRAPAGGVLPTRKLTLPGQNGQSEVILELRAGPVQDLLPPSWHPSGKPYRWLRAPWEVEEVPEPSAALLDLWRRWDELQALLLGAIAPVGGQGQVEQAAGEYHAQQGQGAAGWDEVRRQIREQLPLADLLAQMGVQERGRGRYCCPFHEERNPSFWLHGEIWVCAHGGAPVGFTSSKTGYSVGDVGDLYQYWKNLDSPGKATAELARELGFDLPNSSERAGQKLPPAHSLTGLPRDAILPVEQSAAPLGGSSQPTTRYHRQTAASLRDSYTPTRWLVEGLLPQPGLLLLAGIPGIGKTWLDLSLSLAVAAGCPWLNRFQACQGPVLLVLEEEDSSAVLERLDLLYAGLGLSEEAGDALPVHFLIQQGVSLVTPERTLDPELVRQIQEIQPALVVLDPFRRVHGLDENDSGAMSHLLALLRSLTRVTERPCSVVLVHHLRKRSDHPEDALDRLRGSSDIPASADSVLEIAGEFGHLVVKHSKSKRGPALGVFIVEGDISAQAVSLKFIDPDIKAEIDREALRGWLIEVLSQGGPQNLRQLCEAGKPRGYGKERIKRLLEALETEDQIQSKTGPRNSRIYTLAEQSARGARVPPTTTEAADVEVVL